MYTSFAKIKWRENSTLWLLNLFDKHQPTPLHNTVISICLNLIEALFQIQLMDNMAEPKCKIGTYAKNPFSQIKLNEVKSFCIISVFISTTIE